MLIKLLVKDVRFFVKDENGVAIPGASVTLEKSGGDPVAGSPFTTYGQGQTTKINDLECFLDPLTL